MKFRLNASACFMFMVATLNLFVSAEISVVHDSQVPPVVVAMIENGPLNAVNRWVMSDTDSAMIVPSGNDTYQVVWKHHGFYCPLMAEHRMIGSNVTT